MIIPTVDSKRAVLFCEALRRPTWHTYICTSELSTPLVELSTGEKVGGKGWEHIFQCEESGAQRRWGFDDPWGRQQKHERREAAS